MTKKEMFAVIREAMADNAEVVAFCDHEIELLSKKRSSSPTKTQIANEAVKNEILDALAKVSEPVTVSEILALLENSYTNQKISALLRQLKDAGKVEKIVDKKVSRFILA